MTIQRHSLDSIVYGPQWKNLTPKEEPFCPKIAHIIIAPFRAIATLFIEIARSIKRGFIWIIGGSLQQQYARLIQLHQHDPKHFEEAKKYPSRNRYDDVLPNEPTRFKISSDPEFYFNANWVLNQHAIACQGPLDTEIDEFWKMIWQADINTIVMLTNPVETGREKCSKYWKSMDFEEEKIFENGNEAIIKRTIQISGWFQTKTVVQYHLQNWPDHGIVSPDTLAQLVKIVAKEDGKVLAHCSAGIGRTGTFLAAYEAHRQKTGEIFPIASDLRDPHKGRVGMIQSAEQYQLAHQTAQKLLSTP